MSTYNVYAQRLDAAYKAARDEYAAAYTALRQAEDAERNARIGKPGDTALDKQVSALRATAEKNIASAKFKEVKNRVWASFNRQRSEIRAELEKELSAATTVDPDAIDNNALELLKSGVMQTADYFALAAKYDTNPTMLRVLSRYAREAAGTAENRQTAQQLTALALECQNGTRATMRAFDSICRTADYCSGQRYPGERANPQHIVSMGKRWEELTSEAVENF